MDRFGVPMALMLGVALTLPASLQGQSFVGFRAFGVPVDAIGARAIGSGNLGIGYAGVEVSSIDPTASARLLAPTVSASMQPTWGDFTLSGQGGGSSTSTRFPLLAIGYPVESLGGAITASLGGFMEQRWVTEVESFNDLGGMIVPSIDRFESDGGSSVARLGWAHRLSETVALGVMGGAYLGRLNQSFSRTLDSLTVGGIIQPFLEAGAWRYSGNSLTLGASADPSDLLHFAGAVEWSSELTVTPQEGTSGATQSFGVPMRLSAGATATLSSRLFVNTSFRIQDWSGASGFDPGVTSGGSVGYGAGVEWRAIEGETRSLPLRFGYRSTPMPFRFAAEDASESALTLGLGLNLVEVDGVRFGWVDLAFERGSRVSAPIDETFWRGTFSLGITGF